MSDSDNEYIEDHSSGDDHNLNVGGSGRAQRQKGSGRNATSKPGTRARWERALRDTNNEPNVVADDSRLAENISRRAEAQKRARIRKDTKPFQRGIIRHMVLVLDVSEMMLEKDMRPNRYRVMLRYLEEYILEFFEQNPISQITVLMMYDGRCIQLSELSGNPNDHINAIQKLRDGDGKDELPKEPKGSPSLQNALEMSRAMLYHTPKHGTREVLIILGALLTNDPGDIHKTIASCVKDKLRVSIIGIFARMKICTEIVSRTNGGDESGYGVATDDVDLRDLLMASTSPPAMRATEQEDAAANLLVMGFPSRTEEEHPSLCACHGELTRGGYICPRCKTKVCSLPQTCPSCQLTLILSTHLARSYHHLFPLRNWLEVSWDRVREMRTTQCKGCLKKFPGIPTEDDGADKMDGSSESSRYECPSCHHHFCVDCDVFCHQTLYNCPGCQSGPPAQVPASNGETTGDPMALDGAS
ncbi:TFIIH basal transcription factor complex, subunit SSL1 [Microthyrium microscopicum]|uniref:General transcription and DNA repair factor IIH n=1 Tax=Microthyrium microscopicum TaxID=703497 RepID=A0A6A6UKS1_9PEZI|nr:TFIIH basal transcription factor complex, subunit SSL1 [Microthyrium microscopicum]